MLKSCVFAKFNEPWVDQREAIVQLQGSESATGREQETVHPRLVHT